jgi:predicted transcriptional regulator
VTDLSATEREVLRAFMTRARKDTASVAFSDVVEALPRGSQVSVREVVAALNRLQQTGHLTRIQFYGPGRKLIPSATASAS